MKSYLLSFDCSLPEASLAIVQKEPFKRVFETHWKHQAQLSPHSSQLLIEITKALKKLNLSLKDFSALAVGIGPGRFTGVRTALCVAKAFSYSLKIPIYPVNSLKALAESFLAQEIYLNTETQALKNPSSTNPATKNQKPESQALEIQNTKTQATKTCYVAIYGFKKQIYWASPQDQFQKTKLLSLEDWEKQIQKLPPQSVCLSDIPDFYELKPAWKSLRFIKPRVSAYCLAKQALSLKKASKTWRDLNALYLRDSF